MISLQRIRSCLRRSHIISYFVHLLRLASSELGYWLPVNLSMVCYKAPDYTGSVSILDQEKKLGNSKLSGNWTPIFFCIYLLNSVIFVYLLHYGSCTIQRLKMGLCVDILFSLFDCLKIYIDMWAHWENLGRTFRKGVRPWAHDFVWPNASLVA